MVYIIGMHFDELGSMHLGSSLAKASRVYAPVKTYRAQPEAPACEADWGTIVPSGGDACNDVASGCDVPCSHIALGRRS